MIRRIQSRSRLVAANDLAYGLPDVPGRGLVPNLSVAIDQDASGALAALVQSFDNATSIAAQNTILDQILLKWTNSETIIPSSDGIHVDARIFNVVEQFAGQTFVFDGNNGNPGIAQAPYIYSAYAEIKDDVYGMLDLNGPLQAVQAVMEQGATFDPDTGDETSFDLTGVANYFINLNETDPTTASFQLAEFLQALQGLQITGMTNYQTFYNDVVSASPSLQSVLDYQDINPVSSADNSYIDRSDISVDETITATGTNDHILVGSGDVNVIASGGNDWISGGLGNDTITLGGGSNYVALGTGSGTVNVAAASNDNIISGYGNTTINLANDFGNVELRGAPNESTPPSEDVVNFASGIIENSVIASVAGNDLTLEFGANSIYMPDALAPYADKIVSSFTFSDGNSYTLEQLAQGVTETFSADNQGFTRSQSVLDETITLSGSNDSFAAGSGNEQINDSGNNNTIYLGAGSTTIHASGNNETVQFGSGNATVYAATNSIIYGNTSGGTIYANNNDTVNAGFGATTIYGGNDTVVQTGLEGSVTLTAGYDDVFYANGSTNTINITDNSGLTILNESAVSEGSYYGNNDIAVFGNDTTASDLSVTSNGTDLLIVDVAANAELLVTNNFGSNTRSLSQIEIGGSIETVSDLLGNSLLVNATQSNTALDRTNSPYNENISVSGNNDTIRLGNGINTLVDSGTGNLVLLGSGTTDDTLGQASETFAGAGLDTYRVHDGMGSATLIEEATSTGSVNDSVIFDSDVSVNDVVATGDSYGNLTISDAAADFSLTIWDAFASTGKQIGSFVFSDGTYTLAEMSALAVTTITNSTDDTTVSEGTATGLTQIQNSGSNDTINLSSGNVIVTDSGTNNVINTGDASASIELAENDVVNDGTEKDTYLFNKGFGNATVNLTTAPSDGVSQDLVVFGSGINLNNIQLATDSSNDLIISDSQGDSLDLAGALSSTVAKQVGSFVFADGTNITNSELLAQKDVTLSVSSSNSFIGLQSSAFNEVVTHNGANDTIIIGSGNDRVFVGNDDVLYLGSGNNNVTVGENDTIYSGSGSNTIAINSGSGTTVIHEGTQGAQAGNTDTIAFGTGINKDAITLIAYNENSLEINIGSSDHVIVSDFWDGFYSKPVSDFTFSDGSSLSVSQLLQDGVSVSEASSNSSIVRTGSSANETIVNTGSNDSIYLGSGADTVAVGDNDTVYAGNNAETIFVNAGTGTTTVYESSAPANNSIIDTVRFGAGVSEANVSLSSNSNGDLIVNYGGNDELVWSSFQTFSQKNIENFDFADGTNLTLNQLLARGINITNSSSDGQISDGFSTNNENITHIGNNDQIYLGSGNDNVVVGTNDTVNGGSGADSIFISADSGTTIINEFTSPTVAFTGDSITFGAGVAPDNLQLGADSNGDLIIQLDSNDEVQISNAYGGWFYNKPVTTFNFSDGETLGINDLLQMGVTISSSDSTIDRSQSLLNDVITHSGDSDQIYLGSGLDDITLGTNDMVYSGTDSDNFQIAANSGNSTIVENNNAVIGSADNIVIGSGVSFNDVQLSSNSNDDLILSFDNSSVDITGALGTNTQKGVQAFYFADGSIYSFDEMLQKGDSVVDSTSDAWLYRSNITSNENITHSGSDDFVVLGSGQDTFTHDGSNDQINLGSGNDTVVVGTNDTVNSGGGSDTFDVNVGSGTTTIYETASSTGTGSDTINFGAGITSSGTTLSANGSDLIVSVGGTDQVILSGELDTTSSNKDVATFTFADGTDLSLSELLARGVNVSNSQDGAWIDLSNSSFNAVVTNTGTNDLIITGSYNDTVNDDGSDNTIWTGSGATTLHLGDNDQVSLASGNATIYSSSNDTITGGSADMTLTAGANDTVYASSGNDHFNVAPGIGSFVINETAPNTDSNSDTIEVSAAINPNDVVYTQQGDNLLVTLDSNNDTILIQGQFASGNKQVSTFIYDDPETISLTQLEQSGQIQTSSNGTTSSQSATSQSSPGAPSDSTNLAAPSTTLPNTATQPDSGSQSPPIGNSVDAFIQSYMSQTNQSGGSTPVSPTPNADSTTSALVGDNGNNTSSAGSSSFSDADISLLLQQVTAYGNSDQSSAALNQTAQAQPSQIQLVATH